MKLISSALKIIDISNGGMVKRGNVARHGSRWHQRAGVAASSLKALAEISGGINSEKAASAKRAMMKSRQLRHLAHYNAEAAASAARCRNHGPWRTSIRRSNQGSGAPAGRRQ